MQKCYALQAYDCATALGDPVAVAEAEASLAVASCWTGELGAASVHADRVAARLDALDNTSLRGSLPVLADLSWVETQLQRLPKAEAHQRRGLRVAEAAEAEEHWILFQVLFGATMRELGRLKEAERHTERAWQAADMRESDFHRELALIAFGEIALETGDNERAREVAAQAHALSDLRSRFKCAALMLMGITMIQTGELYEGRDLVLEAAGGKRLPLVPAASRARVHAVLASADARLGQQADALRWSEQATTSASQCRQGRAHGYAQLARAEALLTSDPHGALHAAEAARAAFEEAGAPLGAAAAHLVNGVAQERLGHTGASAEALARSEELYRYCAATTAADNVRIIRATMRANPPASGARNLASMSCLTPREMQVARLMAQGRSNRQIAHALDIKLNTVQVHVGRILRKLRVESRTAVARIVTLLENTETASARTARTLSVKFG